MAEVEITEQPKDAEPEQVSPQEVRELLEHLFNVIRGAGLPLCPTCMRAHALYQQLATHSNKPA